MYYKLRFMCFNICLFFDRLRRYVNSNPKFPIWKLRIAYFNICLFCSRPIRPLWEIKREFEFEFMEDGLRPSNMNLLWEPGLECARTWIKILRVCGFGMSVCVSDWSVRENWILECGQYCGVTLMECLGLGASRRLRRISSGNLVG